jgi:hypothetical protein
LKAAGLVFELAGMDLEDATISLVTSEYVKNIVARGDLCGLDEQESEE